MHWKQVATDFVVGGALVAGALLLAAWVSPVAGGVLAGAPIRTGAVILLSHLHGKDVGTLAELSRGVLIAMLSNVAFAAVLYAAIPRLGFWPGFGTAIGAFLVCAFLIGHLTGAGAG
jgi:hypothetical protein